MRKYQERAELAKRLVELATTDEQRAIRQRNLDDIIWMQGMEHRENELQLAKYYTHQAWRYNKRGMGATVVDIARKKVLREA